MNKQNIDLLFNFKQSQPIPVEPEPPQEAEQKEDAWSILGYALSGAILGAAVILMVVRLIEYAQH